jgi:hypothetical protein
MPKRQNQGKCHHGGKRVTRDRRERTSELVTAVRLAVALWELIWDLIRDHLGQGGGHGPGVPATEVAAWAGHSVEVLMHVYARCVTGLEDVWISRMDDALRLAGDRPDTDTEAER